MGHAVAPENPWYSRQTPEGARSYELLDKRGKKMKQANPSNWEFTHISPEKRHMQRRLRGLQKLWSSSAVRASPR